MARSGQMDPGRPLTKDHWQRLETLFERLLDLPPVERSAALDLECAGDSHLRAELSRMLGATSEPSALAIERRFVHDGSSSDAAIGMRCGPYRLVAHLGDGGSGTVYLAERDDGQFQQQVAIKLIRGTRVWPALMARVKVEREALALLQHPHIARLFDAGTTDDHVPFLVMEYVDGVPITDYAAQHRLGLEARLRLFLPVCTAVQYAHGRLVVHRDLKPTNVFVTSAGEVRLLDFGIAKLLSSTDHDAVTRDGTRPFTPDYAAPEQLAGGVVTTATDVYGLGVLLAELVGGVRPSRSTAGAHVLSLEVRDHQAWRDRLRRDAGDLGRIIACALHPEPQRRYASADALADELNRFLTGRPVHARPDSVAYRASRFVRRNWMAVSAAAAAVLLVAAFAALAAWQARALAHERDAAALARDRAEEVAQTLVDVFETTNPEVVAGADALTVRAWLDEAERRVLGSLDDGMARASLQSVFGRIRLARTQLPAARTLLQSAFDAQRRTLGPDAHATLATQLDLIDTLVLLEERPAALALHREALHRLDSRAGSEPLLLARALMTGVTSSTSPIESLRRAVGLLRSHVPPGDPSRLRAQAGLATELGNANLVADAEAVWRDVLVEAELPAASHTAVRVMVLNDYAAFVGSRGRADEAERYLARARDVAESVYGPRSYWHATIANNLAVQRAQRGDVEGANRAFIDAHEQFVAVFGPHHWQSANIARNVGLTFLARGDTEACRTWLEPAARVFSASTPETPGALLVDAQAQRCAFAAGDVRRALDHWSSLLSRVDRLENSALPRASMQLWMAAALLQLGRAGEAETLARAALAVRSVAGVTTGLPAAEAECELGAALEAQGRATEARPLLLRCAPLYTANRLIEAVRRDRVRAALGHVSPPAGRTAGPGVGVK